jgi:SOS response regulatory protein OraA/RecX
LTGPPQDNQEKIKQIRFLQGRGIDSSVIQKILSGKSFEYYENVN